jgi:hypothetical protein
MLFTLTYGPSKTVLSKFLKKNFRQAWMLGKKPPVKEEGRLRRTQRAALCA